MCVLLSVLKRFRLDYTETERLENPATLSISLFGSKLDPTRSRTRPDMPVIVTRSLERYLSHLPTPA
jgi:hypothetical protein